jgi:hypothetical protein
MRYVCGISALTMFVSIAAAGSSWPWSLLAMAAGALSLGGLFASAARLGLFDPARTESERAKESKGLKKAA